jgi:preprotein translocase subunit SecE
MRIIKKIVNFFTEIKEELRKVNWPSKQELRGALVIVMVAFAFLTIYIALVDLGLSRLTRVLLHG